MAKIQNNDKDARRVTEKEDPTLLYDATVVVVLQRIHDYLESNIDAFEKCSEHRRVEWLIPELGELTGLEPQGFHLQQTINGENLEVALKFSLVREENGSFLLPHHGESEQQLVRMLKKQGVRVIGSRILGGSGADQQLQLEVKSDIPVKIRFVADNALGVLKLAIHNFAAMGEERYIFQPDQVDENFFRELGDMLSGRETDFLQNASAMVRHQPGDSLPNTLGQVDSNNAEMGLAQAEIIDFDPITLTGKREIVLSYRDMTFSFDRHRPLCQFGRKFPAEILVRSRFVSRTHATLHFTDNQFIFEDHSANGTFVKIGSKDVTFLHHEKLRLKGNGVISLGVSIASEKRDLIFFEVT